VNVTSLVDSGGYAAVFGLVMAESFGVPLPGETALIAAAGYAGASHDHRLNIWAIFAAAAAAAVLGGVAGYWIGDRGGYRLLRHWRVEETKLKVARYLFARHGGKVVFFGRFVSVLRTYASFLAGVSKMPLRRFLVWNTAGGVLWAALYAFGAYYAGGVIDELTTPVDIGVGVVAFAVIVLAVLAVRRHFAELASRAEAAFPGPLSR
jgi:membrane protein DedA with SNARE-associated domain